jgi:hypothetical protein
VVRTAVAAVRAARVARAITAKVSNTEQALRH